MVDNIIKSNMLIYCLKWRRNTKNIDPKMVETRNGRTMLLSRCLKW